MKPYLIDSHAHLQDSRYSSHSTPQIISEAQAAGVEKIICIGSDLEQSKLAIKLANESGQVWASVGLHPHDAKELKAQSDQLEELLLNDKVVAVGECGLDYYYQNSPRDAQKQALITQLNWARLYNLPLALHIRASKQNPNDAFDDLWSIWQDFSDLRAVVHSFSSSVQNLNRAIERNMFIALNGIVSFSNHPEHDRVVKAVPLDKLLLETDSPYLTPSPFRGKINMPKYLESTAKHIADTRGVEITEIISSSTKNTELLFSI